jgi:hypothetical protein
MVTIKPGARFKSAVCDTEVMVVKGGGELDLRCGGAALINPAESGAGEPEAVLAGGSLIGKRYVTVDGAVELLCIRGGAGSLSLGNAPLEIKQAEALPSSD